MRTDGEKAKEVGESQAEVAQERLSREDCTDASCNANPSCGLPWLTVYTRA